ncbi:MAG: lytic transglycosylase domain-containing protein [Clostridia bacterium]|nr:lytic transglycosylase domain-containing protein [Clostridia bacterium]
MNWKNTARRSVVIVVILVLSILCALVYQLAWDEIDRRRYPQEFSEYVTEFSDMYGVPEYVIYAVIKVESDFTSNAESHAGAIGLMQIMPDSFDWISMRLKRTSEVGMMYDPRTNIEYGTYYLSYLYTRYNRWDTVFAAYNAGFGRVDQWLSDPEYTDEDGNLIRIPIAETKKYVKKVNDAIDVYKRLYYQ